MVILHAPFNVDSEKEPLSNDSLAYRRLLMMATNTHPNSVRLAGATVMEMSEIIQLIMF